MEQFSSKGLNEYEFAPGKILLEDQRYVLMGADALGALKRDLTSALGLERAKGFMLRYGWNYGKNYAKKLKSMYPQTTTKEWFFLGPKIHSQTGSTLVTPSQITYDEKKGYYYAEGFWTDSYEAEQHRKYFGISKSPVCYIASGHAGGYISELLGRTAICKEMECQGKGDPQCRWVIKPLEDWDDEVKKEMHYYEEKNLEIELDRAYKRIESQKIILQDVLKLNEELSRALVEGNTLPEIIAVLGRNLHIGVVMEDRHFRELASYNINEHDYVLGDYITQNQQLNSIISLQKHYKTTHLSISAEDYHSHERLITPIMIKNQIYGYLSLVKTTGSFNETEFISLERAATICSIKLLNDMTALEVEHRLLGQVLDELLSENAEERNLHYRMNLMGYDLNVSHYLVLVDVSFAERKVSKSLEELKDRIKKQMIERIKHYFEMYKTKCLVSIKLNQLVVLIPNSVMLKEKQDAKSFIHRFMLDLQNHFDSVSLIAGVSSMCDEIKDYRRGYEEASKAIRIATLRENPSSVMLFEELGLFSKIFGTENMEELKRMAGTLLNNLKEYDESHGTELLRTLYYYLESQGNLQQTSTLIKASVGSVRYRLKRVKEISNIDVTKSKDFYEAYLAIQIQLFLGIIEV